jgi:hypothetical protein
MSTDWTAKIKAGDVLKSPSGVLRVVRVVKHFEHPNRPPKCAVTFTILNCSWTGRGTTTYFSNDLRAFGYRPTKARVRLNTKIDRMIKSDRENSPQKTLTCCMVRGIS